MLAQSDCCRQFTDLLTNLLTHSFNSLTHLPSPTASMATCRSACTAPITTGSSKAARPHSASWQRQLASYRHEAPSCSRTAGSLGSSAEPRPLGLCSAESSSLLEAPPNLPIPLPLTTRYDLRETKLRMTRHADFRGRYRIVQVGKGASQSVSQ